MAGLGSSVRRTARPTAAGSRGCRFHSAGLRVDVPCLASGEACQGEHLVKPLVLHAEGACLAVHLPS
jgi:hypothetical protein